MANTQPLLNTSNTPQPDIDDDANNQQPSTKNNLPRWRQLFPKKNDEDKNNKKDKLISFFRLVSLLKRYLF